MEQPALATCLGCGKPMRHPVLRQEGEEGFSYPIAQWHAECVPPDKRSGSNWFRRNK